ncbi:AAA family ATPase [Citromicrobium bathyomarinum]|uniref:AAA family ATPase n=1 Tax=Citromicrobium bathyomarinum TaxID=72174 RepID=UPI00315A4DEB
MINVTEIPINEEDIEDIRLWGAAYREETGMPWGRFAKAAGFAESTLQAFLKGTYKGDNPKCARMLFKYRQTIEAQTKRQAKLPIDPGFFETETSARLEGLLLMAHEGRITAAGTGPGTGKTMSIKDYKAKAPNVYVATMRPSCQRVLPMIQQVQRSMGMPGLQARTRDASQMVIDKLVDRKALLVIDEANYLSIESHEELRAWHDETGVGLALFGNEELIAMIESGRKSDQLARLNRRISHRHIQKVPTEGDVEIFCSAWGIEQGDIRMFLKRIALTPHAGGLGECQQLIEAASLIADGEDREYLSIADLRDAQMARSTRWVKA